MGTTSALIFAFTIIFSPFSAMIAYIITYDEYQHHFDSRMAKQKAFQMALFTFVVFVAVGLVSGFAFKQIASH